MTRCEQGNEFNDLLKMSTLRIQFSSALTPPQPESQFYLGMLFNYDALSGEIRRIVSDSGIHTLLTGRLIALHLFRNWSTTVMN